MNTKITGEFLFQLRKKANLTQKEIAELCNISAQAVSKWEKGENLPDIEFLQKLSILYDVSINEILDGKKARVNLQPNSSEKTKIAFLLVTSILVFIVFLFDYSKGFHTSGYDIIFQTDGYGIAVHLVRAQFIVFISHFIAFLFIITNLIRLTIRVRTYLFFSSIVVALASFYMLGFGASPFPQVLIIFLMFVPLFTMLIDAPSGSVFAVLSDLKTYRSLKKDASLSKVLLPKSIRTSVRQNFCIFLFFLI